MTKAYMVYVMGLSKYNKCLFVWGLNNYWYDGFKIAYEYLFVIITDCRTPVNHVAPH